MARIAGLRGVEAEHQFERHDRRFGLGDLPTVFLEERARCFSRVEIQMGAIENAAIGVIEASEQQRQPDGDVGHIGHRHHQQAAMLQSRADLGQQARRPHQVLQDVEQQDAVEVVLPGLTRQVGLGHVQIGGDVAFQRRAFSGGGQGIHAHDAIALLLQLGCKEAFAAADIQHVLSPTHELPGIVVAGIPGVLDGVVDEVLGELGRAHDATAGALVAAHGTQNVARILQPVHVAQFGSIVGRDRNLTDRHRLMVEFDDDLRVEMKIVGHPGEIQLGERVQIICAISAVKFRQVHAQRAILQNGEDAVARVFI